MGLLDFLRGEYAAGDGDYSDQMTAWDEERIVDDMRWMDDGGRVH